MADRSTHLYHPDIIRFIDRETSPSETQSAREHLAICPECRSRLASAQNTLNNLSSIYKAQSATPISSPDSRARLQQQLAAVRPQPSGWRIGTMHFHPLATAALALFVAGVAFYGTQHGLRGKSIQATLADYGSVPNHHLTPGAVRPVTVYEICSTSDADDDDDLDPAVPASTQNAVLKEYGLSTTSSARTYQIDYLVNPQLGGTNDIKNLWPQPYHQGSWNATAKDELERHLHQMVCEQSVDLAVAQREIETDWIAAYKKYMHSQPPA